jgi:hypothetical protein
VKPMRTIVWGLPLLMLVILIVAIARFFASDFWECENQLLQTATSPDGVFKAVVFLRDCGATTGFNRQVAILRSSERLPKHAAIHSFLAIEDNPKIELIWRTSRELHVRYEFGFGVVVKTQPKAPISVTFEDFVAPPYR